VLVHSDTISCNTHDSRSTLIPSKCLLSASYCSHMWLAGWYLTALSSQTDPVQTNEQRLTYN